MLPIGDIRKLPKASGIYKIRNDKGVVVYVGQSKNIYKRWNDGHHKYAAIINAYGTSATIEWTLIPQWLLNRAENAAVAFHDPVLNQKTPPVV